MSKLVEFLLARAETHPEEFYEDRKSGVKHNWMHYVKQNKKFMSEEEYHAIWEKVSAINLEYQMERVTEKLFEPEDEELNEDSLVDAVRNMYQIKNNQPQKLVVSQQQAEILKAYYERQKEQTKLALETSVFRKEANESNTDRR